MWHRDKIHGIQQDHGLKFLEYQPLDGSCSSPIDFIENFYMLFFIFFSPFHRKPALVSASWRHKKSGNGGKRRVKNGENPPVLHPIGIWLSSCYIGLVKFLLEIKTPGSESSLSDLRLGFISSFPRISPWNSPSSVCR